MSVLSAILADSQEMLTGVFGKQPGGGQLTCVLTRFTRTRAGRGEMAEALTDTIPDVPCIRHSSNIFQLESYESRDFTVVFAGSAFSAAPISGDWRAKFSDEPVGDPPHKLGGGVQPVGHAGHGAATSYFSRYRSGAAR